MSHNNATFPTQSKRTQFSQILGLDQFVQPQRTQGTEVVATSPYLVSEFVPNTNERVSPRRRPAELGPTFTRDVQASSAFPKVQVDLTNFN